MMEIILHTPDEPNALINHYQRALEDAVELYIVSAYLTEWNTELKLQAKCKRFRLIVGKDFGITRKEACKRVLKWLPPNRKADFLVADHIVGFHPKAAFWRNDKGENFMLLGSSNLTRAAFEGNVEANVFSAISKDEFEKAKVWVEWIAERSVPVSEDWLNQYVEASRQPVALPGKQKHSHPESPAVVFKLPKTRGKENLLDRRREKLAAYAKIRPGLMKLFNDCSEEIISSQEFFDRLPEYWSWDHDTRLQGNGWERAGRNADFKELASAFVTILKASKQERDDVVREQLDNLKDSGNPARGAFLSEMLCLRFQNEYPVLNKPVRDFLTVNRFSAPRGASEGSRYIDLAKKLRIALRANPNYPAKNLAELDTLIWADDEQRKA